MEDLKYVDQLVQLHIAVAKYGNDSVEADKIRDAMDEKVWYNSIDEKRDILINIGANLNLLQDMIVKK